LEKQNQNKKTQDKKRQKTQTVRNIGISGSSSSGG
jgi:hypothetical protein